MRQLCLCSKTFSFVVLLTVVFSCAALFAADNPAGTNSNTISGRVLDSVTRKPVPATVVVALESQPGGSIVNATSPNADGSFSFSSVAPGNYAIVVTGENSGRKAYAPVLVVGKGLVPGAKLGTIALKPSAAAAKKVSVPVESNTPITVTLTVSQKVDQYSFALPWADGVPTFDTAARNCSGSNACGSFSLNLPPSAMQMANFDGKSLQYLPKPLTPNYTVTATAYTQNGAKPTCESRNSAPKALSGAAVESIQFTGCE